MRMQLDRTSAPRWLAVALFCTAMTPVRAQAPILDVPGTYATIQAAIDAATFENTVVRVAAGDYGRFEINGTVPSGIRVVATGPATVSDPLHSPIKIIGRGYRSTSVEGFTVHFTDVSPDVGGIAVRVCVGTVVLDRLVVLHSPGANTPYDVAAWNVSLISMQQCTFNSTLLIGLGNYAISGGSLPALEVFLASTVSLCGVAHPPLAPPIQGTITEFTGPMPTLVTPDFVNPGQMFNVDLQAFAASPWVLAMSAGFTFEGLTAPWEMPLLINLADLTILATGTTDAAGHAFVPFAVPQSAALLGVTVRVQAIDLGTTKRFSNVRSTTVTP